MKQKLDTMSPSSSKAKALKNRRARLSKEIAEVAEVGQ